MAALDKYSLLKKFQLMVEQQVSKVNRNTKAKTEQINNTLKDIKNDPLKQSWKTPLSPQKLGSMLDIVNITKTCGVQKSCIEPMATYFTIEMLGMVDALHKAEILHADIKADNFLLQGIPLPNQVLLTRINQVEVKLNLAQIGG